MRGGEEGLTWVGGLGRPVMVAAWRLYGRTGAACCAATREPAFGVARPRSIVHTVRQPGAPGILRSRERLSGGQVLLGVSIGSGIIGTYRAKTDCAQPSVGGGNF